MSGGCRMPGGCAIALALLAAGCRAEKPKDVASTNTCSGQAMRVAEQLGTRMREVSLLAPDSVVGRELSRAYEDLVTPELLGEWRRAPAGAPGREVSNPWPARIEVRDTSAAGRTCQLHGEIVYVTTADTTAAADRRAVALGVINTASGWRISAYDAAPAPTARDGAAPPSPARDAADSTPQAVVRRYYAAIAARRYRDAYALWSQDGAASKKSFTEFSRGFSDTKDVRATVSGSVQVEGAAGSQYATVPVSIDAILNDGTAQHFSGTYTLRRAMVDGATTAQRTWHIYTARLSR